MISLPVPTRIYVARITVTGGWVIYTVASGTKADLRALSFRGSSPGTTWTASVFIEPSAYGGEDIFQVTGAADYSVRSLTGTWLLNAGDRVGINFSHGSGLDVWLSGVVCRASL